MDTDTATDRDIYKGYDTDMDDRLGLRHRQFSVAPISWCYNVSGTIHIGVILMQN
jgi:hypothetical protein